MKKSISLLLILCLLLPLVACTSNTESRDKTSENDGGNVQNVAPMIAESPAEDFNFEMRDGEIFITGYKGSDRKIRIPETINDRPVTRIGEAAFENYDMTHMFIPDTVTIISEEAFSCCDQMEYIKLPNDLEMIYDEAFYGCHGLKEINVPDNVKRIGISAFANCSSLQSVTLPEKLEYLAEDAFGSCGALDTLKIPDNTELNIYYTTRDVDSLGTVTSFTSPVGTRIVYSWKDETIEPFRTTLVVNKGSYAHSQTILFEEFGLTVVVE